MQCMKASAAWTARALVFHAERQGPAHPHPALASACGPVVTLPKDKVCVISPLTGESAPNSGNEPCSAGGSTDPKHGGGSRSKSGVGSSSHLRSLGGGEPTKNGHAACRG